MKPLHLTLLLLCFVSGATLAQVSSTCTPSALFLRSYSNDIKDLAVARMYAIQSPDTSQIFVPQRYIDTIGGGMAAIANVDSLIDADSVFRKYCIHSYPFGFIKPTLKVKVDTSYAWARQWAAMHNTTGYGRLDSFMSRNGFTLRSYYCVASNPEYLNNFATISCDSAVNTKAFADSLALFAGVTYMYFDNIIGDHNFISYQRGTDRIYNFRLGWGDCLAGCTSEQVWQYRVDDACRVMLQSVTGGGFDPFPSPINCNMAPFTVPTENQIIAVTAYPNPAQDILHLTVSGFNKGTLYSIYDLLGRELFKGEAGTATTINTSWLKAGVYILRVTSGGLIVYNSKIVKQ